VHDVGVQLAFTNPDEFVIFLSSGDDALRLRDLVEQLAQEAVNPELLQAQLGVRLIIDRWERTAPGRTAGEAVNSWFVRRATTSSLALCLLIRRLGTGTREEIEAVLGTDGVDLSVIWFVDRTTWPRTAVGSFLDRHKDHLYIDRAGPPTEAGAAVALVRLLLHVVMQRLSQQREDGFRERR